MLSRLAFEPPARTKRVRTGDIVTEPEPATGVLTWVLRAVLALAALAAPILVYQGFTDSDAPDPAKQQRLREVSRTTAEPGPANRQ
jgi:hypothetical protein